MTVSSFIAAKLRFVPTVAILGGSPSKVQVMSPAFEEEASTSGSQTL